MSRREWSRKTSQNKPLACYCACKTASKPEITKITYSSVKDSTRPPSHTTSRAQRNKCADKFSHRVMAQGHTHFTVSERKTHRIWGTELAFMHHACQYMHTASAAPPSLTFIIHSSTNKTVCMSAVLSYLQLQLSRRHRRQPRTGQSFAC